MGYPVRIQAIKRKKSVQWVVNLPSAIAAAMDFVKSEIVEWEIQDKRILKLKRVSMKKKS